MCDLNYKVLLQNSSYEVLKVHFNMNNTTDLYRLNGQDSYAKDDMSKIMKSTESFLIASKILNSQHRCDKSFHNMNQGDDTFQKVCGKTQDGIFLPNHIYWPRFLKKSWFLCFENKVKFCLY